MNSIAERNTPETPKETTELPRELKVNADKLATEVAWLAKMPTTQPVTAIIQVTSLLSAVMLRRTCFEQYQESVVPAKGIDQGSVLVDAEKLAAALKSVSGEVVITISGDTLRINDGERIVRLKTADSAIDFPPWPRFEGQGKVAVNSREMVQVLTSAGADEAYPQLMTVAFDDGTMITTDRFRLSAVTYSPTGFVGIVPVSVLKPFVKADTVVFVEAGTVPGDPDKWLELRSGMRTVTAPIPDAEFPRWRQLVPEDAPLRVLLPREALLRAISGEEITIAVDGETVSVYSSTDDIETEQTLQVFRTVRNDLAGPFRVSIRSKYAKDALRALNSGLVLFEATTPIKPVVFRDISEKELHLIMPTRQAG